MGDAVVVVDLGSCTLKAGLAGDSRPRVVIPSIVGHPKHASKPGVATKTDQMFFGDEADLHRGACRIKYPIEYGIVTNWDDVEHLLNYTFRDKLGVNPEDHPVMFTEQPINPKCNREKITQIMFEQFNVPAFHLQDKAVLSLYGVGRTTGLVLGLGGGAFSIGPVYEGFLLRHLVPHVPWNGRDITDLLRKELRNNDHITSQQKECIETSAYTTTLRDIKHKHCFVSSNFPRDLQQSHVQTTGNRLVDDASEYELPDGTFLYLNKERFIAPECIFDPFLTGYEMCGVHEQVYNALRRADEEIQPELFSNVLLSGGSSLFPGLPERFKQELDGLNKTKHTVKIISPENRQYLPWLGGSNLACLKSSSGSWISKDEYDEEGPMLVHTKCIS